MTVNKKRGLRGWFKRIFTDNWVPRSVWIDTGQPIEHPKNETDLFVIAGNGDEGDSYPVHIPTLMSLPPVKDGEVADIRSGEALYVQHHNMNSLTVVGRSEEGTLCIVGKEER